MSELGLVNVGHGHSFYDFCSHYSLEESRHPSTHRALHRLCSLMRKMNVQMAVVELLQPKNQEIEEEYIAINKYFESNCEIIAYRLTFILHKIEHLKELEDLPDEAFLSSSIIINFREKDEEWKSYLYKAIVVMPQFFAHFSYNNLPLMNYYLHVSKTFVCEIADKDGNIIRKFQINGTYFTQQNSATSVCAHAALTMAINNSMFHIDWVSTERINSILEKKWTKKIHETGLSPEEMYNIFKKLGLNVVFMDFFEDHSLEYNQVIYHYIESGYPVLLLFTTGSVNDLHVVTLLGHTINSDLWKSEAEPAYTKFPDRLVYKPTSKWVDNFIIQDDNFGMYLNLPIDALKKITFPKYDPIFRARYAFTILPNDVTTSSLEAEYVASVVTEDILKDREKKGTLDPWSQRIIQSPESKVIRTFLVNKDEYTASLDTFDFDGNEFSDEEKKVLVCDLPDRFWLSEITTIDLYLANKSKIIDFIYRCDLPQLEVFDDALKRWSQIRFPGVLIKKNNISKSISLEMKPMSILTHYKMLKFQTQKDTLDW